MSSNSNNRRERSVPVGGDGSGRSVQIRCPKVSVWKTFRDGTLKRLAAVLPAFLSLMDSADLREMPGPEVALRLYNSAMEVIPEVDALREEIVRACIVPPPEQTVDQAIDELDAIDILDISTEAYREIVVPLLSREKNSLAALFEGGVKAAAFETQRSDSPQERAEAAAPLNGSSASTPVGAILPSERG